MTIDPVQLGPRIRALPRMERLLHALDGLAPTFLVGGAVRDLLRGAAGVDLDVAVEGDAQATGRELAARLGGDVVEHGRFGTATVRAGRLVLDLASTRRERYPTPGALPTVEPAPLADDLGRRDFTINAMAAALSRDELGRLEDPYRGVNDLDAGRVRVLHPLSFVDDPTRLIRAVRYETRLGFAMDAETDRLAREAALAGALAGISGPRVRDELLDLLAEAEPAAAVARLSELGLDRSMHGALSGRAALVEDAVRGAAEAGADRVLAALAALIAESPPELTEWLEDLHLGRDRADRIVRAAAAAPELAAALRASLRPSELHRLLAPEPPESLALALALGAPSEPILRYLSELRDVRLEVSGDDLVGAGVAPSPAVGRALREALARKLDGEVSGREEELAVALELARGAEAEPGDR